MFLTEKIAVVTGGGRGIGQATALKLASAGATVVLVSRTREELQAVQSQIEAQGGQAMIHVADVTQAADVEALAREVGVAFGRLDILINCAGEAFMGPISDTLETDWDRVIDTNLKGTYLVTRALLDLLRTPESALVVNMASKVGLTGYARVTAYTAAKAGVIGFTRALAQELSPEKVRVVAICPGPVDTPMRWAATPDMDPDLALPAEVVAETILFLTKLGGDVTTSEIVLQKVNYDENLVSLNQ